MKNQKCLKGNMLDTALEIWVVGLRDDVKLAILPRQSPAVGADWVVTIFPSSALFLYCLPVPGTRLAIDKIKILSYRAIKPKTTKRL